MATNMSLKNQIKARGAGAEEQIKIEDVMVEGPSVTQVSDLKAEKSSGYSSEVLRREKPAFKLGYKAYIQLALRTGQYKALNVIEIYEGELKLWNPITEELVIDFQGKLGDSVIGYAGYFELLNGFKKCVYWTKKKLEKHMKKLRKGDFDYKKIVVRDMLTKWGILSLDMQSAYATELNNEVLLYKPLLKEEEIYSLDYDKEVHLEA